MKAKIQKTISPIDGMIYAERELSSAQQIENTLAKSVIAQKGWQRISIAARINICRKMLAYLVERA